MSARADEALPLLCDLGWHRPDGLARWNDGYYFSKCSRCKRDLVRTAFGSWQVPKGFRVVWQQKPPETREEITLVPKELESVGAAAPVGVVDSPPLASPAEEERAETRPEPPISPVVDEVPAAPEAVFPPVLPEQDEPLAGPAAHAPLNGAAEEAAPAETAAEPELPLAEPSVRQDGPADETDLIAVPADHQPMEGHPSEEPPIDEVATSTDTAPAAAEGRQELPIEEVLRHLQATPLPEAPPEAVEAESNTDLPDVGTGIDEAGEPEAEIESPQVQSEAAPDAESDTLQDEAIAEPAEAALLAESPVEEAVVEAEPDEAPTEFQPEPLGATASEPHEEPVSAPEAETPPASAPPIAPRPLRPIPTFSSDWDFMKEEEEDPITSFWEDPSPPEAAVTPSEAEPATEADEIPAFSEENAPAVAEEDAATEQPSAEAEDAPEQRETYHAFEAAVEDPRALAITDAFAIERSEPADVIVSYEPAEPEDAEPPPRAIPIAAEDELHDPHEDTVPTFRPLASDSASDPEDVVPTPDWVDRADSGNPAGDGGDARPRSSRLVVAAALGVGLFALVAAIVGRPEGSPVATPKLETPPPVLAAPITPRVQKAEPVAAAPVEAKAPAPPAAPVALPALPAREQAFVTASVLQCRSAPVERSTPVRKLVRGAQVQILAREDDWISVAHKGRQCWAAARFLSAAQPW